MNDSVKLNGSVHVYHLLWFSLQTLTQMPRCSQSWASLQQSADLRWWKMLTLAAHLLDTSLSLVSNASVKVLKTNQTVFHWAVFWVPQFKNGKHFDWREESKIHTVCTLCSELLEETLDRKWNASHWHPVHCLLSYWAGDWLHSTLTTLVSNHQTESGLYNALNIFSFACSVASQWAEVFVNNA